MSENAVFANNPGQASAFWHSLLKVNARQRDRVLFQLSEPHSLASPSPAPLPCEGGEDKGEGARTLLQIVWTALGAKQIHLCLLRLLSGCRLTLGRKVG